MLRRFKETEFDKISYELLEKAYPTQALKSYYYLGVAETLSVLTTIINLHIEKDSGRFNAEIMKDVISDYAKHNTEVTGYYERLQKDNSK